MKQNEKKSEEKVKLTLGSKYHIRSLASREAVLETKGTFKGVVSVGTIDALAISVTEGDMKGKIRVIPTHMMLSIDILEAVKEEEEAADEAHMHYT